MLKNGSHAESHVPRFQERVGTSHPGYMILDRLPWRLRARPSATLHEIQVCPSLSRKDKLVPRMLQKAESPVKGKIMTVQPAGQMRRGRSEMPR
jgi:hypothetical protein